MRFFLRLGEGGLFHVDSDLSQQEFRAEIKAGKDFHPLYDAKGNHLKTYPTGLLTQADVLPLYPIIPFNGKGAQYRSEQQGFVVIPLQYDKIEIVKNLKEMGVTFSPDDTPTIQSYLSSHGAIYLRRMRCNIFGNGMFGKCLIDDKDGRILFISRPLMLIQGDKVLVIYEKSIYELQDNSPFKLFYTPAALGDVAYGMFF